MSNTAFQAITSKQAWYAAAKIEQYYGAMYDEDGKLAKANGTGQFAGIVQYGAENAGEMVTCVKGIFPAIASGKIEAGDKVTVDSSKAGLFKVAGASDVVYGVAVTGVAADGLFALAMADVATPAPAATGE